MDILTAILIFAGQAFTAGAVYGAIKGDIKGAIKDALHAKQTADDAQHSATGAHRRIDDILMRVQK